MSEQPAGRPLPTSASVVVIGGGVGGASVAYHLAELGRTDVVLVDRAELTSGSTFHSAGLVGQLRADPTLTRMNMYSVELYRKLQQGEHPPGWVESGGIRLASSPERMAEIRRQIGWATSYGLPLQEISPAEAQEMFPLIDPTGVVGGAYLASDGYVDPSQLCYALANAGAAAGRAGRTRTPASPASTPSAGGSPGCTPTGAASTARRSSTAAGCSPPRSAGCSTCASRSCRCRTSTSSPTRSSSGGTARCRPCATPTCSCTTGRRSTGW